MAVAPITECGMKGPMKKECYRVRWGGRLSLALALEEAGTVTALLTSPLENSAKVTMKYFVGSSAWEWCYEDAELRGLSSAFTPYPLQSSTSDLGRYV